MAAAIGVDAPDWGETHEHSQSLRLMALVSRSVQSWPTSEQTSPLAVFAHVTHVAVHSLSSVGC